MKRHKVIIIGGGPAGLAAALSVKEQGVDDILIVERDNQLGGILNQCIHTGFGLHTFGEELTGPEYANRYVERVLEESIEYKLSCMVTSITRDRIITTMSQQDGLAQYQAEAIILAMGCRERPRGALSIPGTRPAGIYSAGTAQRLVNVEGVMPGKRVVILGSGDIGLIMARRMRYEGAEVLAVVEIMPKSGGLKRNIVQCLEDYNIPLLLSHTVVDIEGKDRVTGINIAQVDQELRVILGTEIHYECDTLLLSCGLIPENELSKMAGVIMNPKTKGAVVDDKFMTNVPGIFVCGNVLHVHELVDHVSEEAVIVGVNVANYVTQGVV